MKPYSIFRRLAIVPALAFLAFGPLSQAAMVLYYNFDNDTGASGSATSNSAGGAIGNGTYTAGTSGGTTAIVSSQAGVYGMNTGTLGGNALSLTPNANGNFGTQAPHINTGSAASSFGFGSNTNYTAMAWVRFSNQIGDNMIFGQDPGNNNVASLHLGSRDATYHSGHWADDFQAGTTDTANWHHVAYTNTAAGTQEIFVDGVSIGSGPGNTGNPTGGNFVVANNLLIGTSGSAGSFSGLIDEVKVFDTVLTSGDIVMESVIVPETSAAALGLLGLAGLLLRRRR